ncbi:MerR family transcriptional regulator [Streptomyces sp. DSM 41524]|uniref:MerR family transcriptional regulator n=1 Tax=Streptomyces asiaticus subsp. ignotus TaxID=3098222 RepID=A0ABU7Q1U0_9ACTN|nr:MerR family transcriptional regulator [Streptomyces sp. DASNCL29]MEE4595241.1 MerR family transcriptional regulator [Streptomyces sp. DSM 41524]TMU92419.1 MerR family transcriptional regulator [Streptomyces sp. DASNCL29]
MRIGELAKATGATARALRFYEERGLLSSARAGNGYRVYDERAVRRVANIRYLLDAGLTLEDIEHFGACLDGDLPSSRPAEAMLDVARRRLSVLDDRIDTLTRVRDELAGRLAAASGGRIAVSPSG